MMHCILPVWGAYRLWGRYPLVFTTPLRGRLFRFSISAGAISAVRNAHLLIVTTVCCYLRACTAINRFLHSGDPPLHACAHYLGEPLFRFASIKTGILFVLVNWHRNG